MSTMTGKIDEDAALMSAIPIMSAADHDVMNNSLQIYTLIAHSDTFGWVQNLADSLTPQLYVKPRWTIA
jgi:hypothetical protein